VLKINFLIAMSSGMASASYTWRTFTGINTPGQQTFQPFKNVFLSRNLDKMRLNLRIFLEKSC